MLLGSFAGSDPVIITLTLSGSDDDANESDAASSRKTVALAKHELVP
jgi:hypothetical protein